MKSYTCSLLLAFIAHLVLLTLLPLTLFAGKDINFKHLSLDNGLSNSVVYSIIQDTKGYLWFGTEDGLNRYDGYNFTVYKHDPDDPESISNNVIVSLHLDNQGSIWIGTMNGLNWLNPSTGKFKKYKHDKNDPNSLAANKCGVFQSKSGIVWVSTHGGGLSLFDPQEGKFIHHKYDPDNLNSISSNGAICNLEQDSVMWIGTLDGLNKFEINTEKITRFKHDPDDTNSIAGKRIQALMEYDNGRLLIGTLRGIDLFDPKTERIVHLLRNTSDPQIKRDEIKTLFKDNLGNIWAGTYGEGLKHVRLDSKSGYGNQAAFTYFKTDPQNPLSISNNYILS
ncbi:hypothetical protein JYU23_01950, partial [bacterium AH-315-C07]|nr:hypothetical protein [bacterium AH-315-C07]